MYCEMSLKKLMNNWKQMKVLDDMSIVALITAEREDKDHNKDNDEDVNLPALLEVHQVTKIICNFLN